MKFVLFVEGYSEKQALKEFLKRWLDARLSDPVGIQIVRFDGWSELVKDSPSKARMHLRGHDVIAVIALLDLYGPTIYPSNKANAQERYGWAKDHLEKEVGDKRFRQFFAVHESEAWLLSMPALFPVAVRKALPPRVVNPEEVNNEEPPSKLLSRLYWDKTKKTFKKTTDGKKLFSALDPNVAYDKCPKLKELLDEMLCLAKGAGL